MTKFTIYTDGGSRGNPGPAAIGVVIADEQGKKLKDYGEAIGETTNNEAEYRAVIFALQKVKSLIGGEKSEKAHLKVNMDSDLAVNQLNGKFKLEEERLFPLFIKVWNLKQNFAKIEFNYVPREKNKEADRLVNEALNKAQSNLF